MTIDGFFNHRFWEMRNMFDWYQCVQANFSQKASCVQIVNVLLALKADLLLTSAKYIWVTLLSEIERREFAKEVAKQQWRHHRESSRGHCIEVISYFSRGNSLITWAKLKSKNAKKSWFWANFTLLVSLINYSLSTVLDDISRRDNAFKYSVEVTH